MKVEFYFPDHPIQFNSENIHYQELIKVNKGIKNKVHNKIVDLPCLPTKDMKVDLYSFSDLYGFNELEKDWIGNNLPFYHITNILIKVDCLELWLEEYIDKD
jgi:hypothetical protein